MRTRVTMLILLLAGNVVAAEGDAPQPGASSLPPAATNAVTGETTNHPLGVTSPPQGYTNPPSATKDTSVGDMNPTPEAVLPFDKIDLDKDGRISEKEMQQMPQLTKAVREADSNGDGYVAMEEYKAALDSAPHTAVK